MAKKKYYRRVYEEYKALCEQGRQPCSFSRYCRERGLSCRQVRNLLGEEYERVNGIKGYTRQKEAKSGEQYMKLYEDFKALCGNGQQPGSFGTYCEGHGFKRWRVYQFLKRKKLSLRNLPGYTHCREKAGYEEIPFEDIIFEESGFLPAEGGHVITVKVEGNVSVSFPSDTDIETIAKFVSKLGKEAVHVGS